MSVCVFSAAAARGDEASWERIDAPAPGGPPSNTTPPDETGFWERLQAKAFDDICRHLDLRQSFSRFLGPDFVRIDARRRLKRYPDGTLAVVDQARLSGGGAVGPKLIEVGEGVAINIGFSASVEGETFIVRPLHERKSCKEVDRLLNLLDFKTALPFSTKRIAAMQTGELWRMPLTIRLAAVPSIGVPITPETSLELHLGVADQGTVTATLYRLGPQALRFRLRLDRAIIKDAGGSINVAVPLSQLNIIPAAENLVMKQATRLLWKQLRRYAAATLAYSAQGISQGRVLLELTLDPTDPEELEALQAALAGDLQTIARWARQLAFKRPGPRLAEEVGERLSERLGKPDFLGAEEREGTSSSFHLRLPFLFDGQRSSGADKGTIYVLDGSQTQYEVHRAERRSETGFIDVPILGQVHRTSRQRVAEAVVVRDPQGKEGPMLVYSDQYGFLRGRGVDVRDFALGADRVMRLAGTQGRGRNDSAGLPVETLLPLDSLQDEPGPDDTSGAWKTYHAAVSAFTIVFNATAVAQIFAAPVETLVRAIANAMQGSDAALLGWGIDRSTVRADGTLEHDRRKLRRELRDARFGYRDPDVPGDELDDLDRLARTAASLAQDILEAGSAATPEGRAEALSRIIGGKGKSGLEYGEVLEVLVGLVDPAQLTAQFALRVEKGIKNEPDVAARFGFNTSLASEPGLAGLAAVRGRFAAPSELND